MNTYYGSLCSLFYDLDKPKASNEEIDFYMNFTNKKHEILEPMCGSGRVLLEFSNSDYNIEGFDISKEMLNLCQQKLDNNMLHAKIFQGTFETFNTSKFYDFIFIAASSICLLKGLKDLVMALNFVKTHLKKNGVFVFGIETLENSEDFIDNPIRIAKDEKRQVTLTTKKANFDRKLSILRFNSIYDLIENGKTIETQTEIFEIKLYDSIEFDEILTSNGFVIKNKYSNYNFDKFQFGDKLCIYEIGL